jgi:hypothetical protein
MSKKDTCLLSELAQLLISQEESNTFDIAAHLKFAIAIKQPDIEIAAVKWILNRLLDRNIDFFNHKPTNNSELASDLLYRYALIKCLKNPKAPKAEELYKMGLLVPKAIAAFFYYIDFECTVTTEEIHLPSDCICYQDEESGVVIIGAEAIFTELCDKATPEELKIIRSKIDPALSACAKDSLPQRLHNYLCRKEGTPTNTKKPEEEGLEGLSALPKNLVTIKQYECQSINALGLCLQELHRMRRYGEDHYLGPFWQLSSALEQPGISETGVNLILEQLEFNIRALYPKMDYCLNPKDESARYDWILATLHRDNPTAEVTPTPHAVNVAVVVRTYGLQVCLAEGWYGWDNGCYPGSASKTWQFYFYYYLMFEQKVYQAIEDDARNSYSPLTIANHNYTGDLEDRRLSKQSEIKLPHDLSYTVVELDGREIALISAENKFLTHFNSHTEEEKKAIRTDIKKFLEKRREVALPESWLKALQLGYLNPEPHMATQIQL